MKAGPPPCLLTNTAGKGLGEVMAALTAKSQILQLVKLMLRSGLNSAARLPVWLMDRMVDGMAPRSAEPRQQDAQPEPKDPGDDPGGEPGEIPTEIPSS